MKENKKTMIEKKSLSQVTQAERQTWSSIAFIWIGTMICIPMLMVGGMLTAGMALGELAAAAIIGFAICAAIMILTGIQGTDLGLPAVMCATKSFGNSGSRVIMSVLLAVAQIGWFAIQTATCAFAFNTLMTFAGVEFPFWLSCIIWGTVMLVTAVYGFKTLKILNYIAVPALLVLCLYGVITVGNQYGMESILAYVPAQSMPLMSAVSLMVGLFAVGTIINADFTRYAKSRADTVKASLVGVVPAAVFMVLVGAVMAIATQNFDITSVFASIGLPVVGMLVLILATWTTNTGNAYTAGIAVSKIFNAKDEKRPMITLICGAIGIVVAMIGIYDALNAFITILASLVPPIAGAMIADFWIVGKGKASNWHPVRGFNWAGIIAWGAGVCVSLFASFFSPAVDGIIVTLAVYVLLYALGKNTKLFGQGKMSIEEALETHKK